MSLPLPWVDRVFEKLTLSYGKAFLQRWDDMDLNLVKSDWAHELAVFQQSPHRIAFALANLPSRPPSVIEFKALCRQAQAIGNVAALPEPAANPERVAEELAKLAPVRRASGVGMKDWAHRLKNRHAAGENLNMNQIRCYQLALGEAT